MWLRKNIDISLCIESKRTIFYILCIKYMSNKNLINFKTAQTYMYISSITCILPSVSIVQLEMHFQLPDPKITKKSIQQLLLHTCSYALACNLFQSGSERENFILKTGNQKWTIQRNWQHRVHKTKKNKTKIQHNMFWTP